MGVRMAGVPEHFNYPWKILFRERYLTDRSFQWTDVPEGTGRMKDLLAEGEIDCALMLTEGAVKAIAGGLQARILQVYVGSPLLWGVHLGYRMGPVNKEDLRGMKVAISRVGSGSHLMAYLYARSMGWDHGRLEFVRVDHLQKALAYLSGDPDCYFLWEKFTTQPYVDDRRLVRADIFPTPWPCFVWVCSLKALEQSAEELRELQAEINEITSGFKDREDIEKEVSDFYRLPFDQVREWLECTHWSREPLKQEELNAVQDTLVELGLIEGRLSYSDLARRSV